MNVTLLVPIYNDWTAVAALLDDVAHELGSRHRQASVLIVDDGSTLPPGIPLFVGESPPGALTTVDVLHLRRNLGHQRAIAVGLAFLEREGSADAVVVMDGDGEDRPADVNRLLSALEEDRSRIVFAERRRRSEGLAFRIAYWAYRVIHRLLTGERVRVGNFSVVPREQLRRLVSVSDLWNHYAAAVYQARLPFTTIPTTRGIRYAGRSQMNFVSMVMHGLSAMSVFADRIGVRLFVASLAATIVALGATGVLGFWLIAAGTTDATWAAASAALGLLVLVLILLATSLAFVFIVLSGRGVARFLPLRDFEAFISHRTTWVRAATDVQQHVSRH